MRRNLIETLAVALAAAGLAVIPFRMHPRPRVVVGTDRWTVAWAIPAQAVAATSPIVTTTFPTGTARDQTVRQVLTVSAGGRAMRVRFTNEYGATSLRLSRVTVAPRQAGGQPDRHAMHELDFAGQVQIDVLPGSEATSDPVLLSLTPGEDLVVSMAIVGTSPAPTLHQWSSGSEVTPPGSGDDTKAADDTRFGGRTTATYWLATVEVLNPPGAVHAVVALGDDMTDAYGVAPGELTWPELLRQRLGSANVAVINGGVVGNTLFDLGCSVCGDDLKTRTIRDAVNLPGVDRVIVLGGTNDIIRGATAAEVVHGLASIAAILHAHGLRAIGMTIPPRDDGSSGWHQATMEPVREAVNGWLRAAGSFDVLVDADRLLGAAVHPTRLEPNYDLGDGFTLNPAGRTRLADSVPLTAVL